MFVFIIDFRLKRKKKENNYNLYINEVMSYANLTSSVNSESDLLDEANQTTTTTTSSSAALKYKTEPTDSDVIQPIQSKAMLDLSNQASDLLDTTIVTLDSNNLNSTATTNVNNDSSMLSLSQTPLIDSHSNDDVERFKNINELNTNAIDIINSIIPVSSETNYLALNSIQYVKEADLIQADKTVILNNSVNSLNNQPQIVLLNQQYVQLVPLQAYQSQFQLAKQEKSSNNQELSRQSSSFSSKSRYSLRSSNKDVVYSASTGAGTSMGGNNGSISLSLAPLSKKLDSSVNSNQHNILNDVAIVSAGNTANNNTNETSNRNNNTTNLYDTRSLNSSSSPSVYSLNNRNSQTSNPNSSYLNGIIVRDPIFIRGAGNLTIFGVSNRFSEQFPSQLNAKLAPEEFRDTIKQVNNILNKELANSFRWLVFGSIFCCCTLGCSLLPVIFMNKKAKLSINKLLDMENQRLYLKLGLKWRLTKIKCNSNALLEYVILIEFLPTILLYQPD
jgi:hypothetical protein